MNLKVVKSTIEDCKTLLIDNNLDPNDNVTYTIAVFDNKKLVGTGSLFHNVIKMIAVSDDAKGENITATIISFLIKELSNRGFEKYFLFTLAEKKGFFLNQGFSLIVETNGVAFLENSFGNITKKLQSIKSQLKLSNGDTNTIVMNCNPITNGHLYLIEHAAKISSNLLIFLVEEDYNSIPFAIRYDLVSKATKHLDNVHVIPSTNYLISNVTFPSYFLKDLSQKSIIQMNIDALVFYKYFMKTFDIKQRFVGSESLDPMTAKYNEILKTIYQDQLVIVERVSYNNIVISASSVRQLTVERKFDALEKIVPKVTLAFLKTKKGQKIIDEL